MKSTFNELNDKLLSWLRGGCLLAGQVGGDAPTGSGISGLGVIVLEDDVVAGIEVGRLMVEAILVGVEGAGNGGLRLGLLHGMVEGGAGAVGGTEGGDGGRAGADRALSGLRHQREASAEHRRWRNTK